MALFGDSLEHYLSGRNAMMFHCLWRKTCCNIPRVIHLCMCRKEFKTV